VAFFVIPNTAKVGHDPADLGPGVEEGFSLHAFVRMLRSMPTALLMAFTTFLGTGLVMAYAKLFIMERYHVTERQYGALLIVPALIIAASSIPLGATGDRIGNARAVRLGIALCTTAFWTLFVLNGIVSLVIMGSLIGIGFVIAFPAWMAQVSSACDSSQRGAAVGAVGTAQGLGAILGVAVSGFLYSRHAQHIGSIVVPAHGIPFLGCGVMLFISLLLSFTRLTGRTVRPC